MTASGAPSLDISRMGGPQHAEREAAALMDAAERATAPPPAPVSFEEVSLLSDLQPCVPACTHLICCTLCMHHAPGACERGPSRYPCSQEVTEAAKRPEMQSRAVSSQEVRVRGAAGYLAPMSHPPLGPGAAVAPVQCPAYEEGEAEVSALASLQTVHDL